MKETNNFKSIWKIAKIEYNHMTYSSVAWLVILIFTCQIGYNFATIFSGLIHSQSIGQSLWSVTQQLFGQSMSGIVLPMQKYIYLYIPLMTMGLMSREYQTGSIRLLYSSPIKSSSIILGKYLSMMTYGMILMFIIMLPILFTALTVENFDLPMVLVSTLGLYLLILAYSAIGLFMSSITKYQVVAVVGTLAILAFLNFVGGIGQEIPFVKEITYWLSISGRAKTFLDGLLASEDVIYFIIVIALFLSLSIFKLNTEQEVISRKRKFAIYSLIVASALIVGSITTLPSLKFYYDATYTQKNTLSKESMEAIKDLEGGLTITTYVNILDPNFLFAIPRNVTKDKERFEKYMRFKPGIKMKYIYYYDETYNPGLTKEYGTLSLKEKAEKVCSIYNIDFGQLKSPEEIKMLIDLSLEENRFIRVIERENGDKVVIRNYNDSDKLAGEAEVSAALRSFTTKSPNVAFFSTNFARGIDNFGARGYFCIAQDKWFRNSLINQGFNVTKIDLRTEKIADEIDILIISDINEDISDEVIQKIEGYIESGGNLFLLGEYDRSKNTNKIATLLGAEFSDGILIESSTSTSPTLIKSSLTNHAVTIFKELADFKNMGYCVSNPTSVAITYENVSAYQVVPILQTFNTSWIEYDTKDFIDGNLEMNPSSKESVGTYNTFVLLSRTIHDKEQKIVLSGDSDFLSNEELNTQHPGVNSDNLTVIKSLFRWLSDDKYPLYTQRATPNDRKINLSDDSGLPLKIICIAVVPFLLILAGSVLIVRRQRK